MYIFTSRHGIYYFRRVLTYSCVDVDDVCRYELRLSLRTRKKRYAYQFAAIISHAVDVLMKDKVNMTDDKSTLDLIISEMRHELIGSIQSTMRKLCVNESVFTEGQFEYVRKKLSMHTFDITNTFREDYLNGKGCDVTASDSGEQVLIPSIDAQKQIIHEIGYVADEFDNKGTISTNLRPGLASSPSSKGVNLTFVINMWLEEKAETGGISGRNGKTISEYHSKVHKLVEYFGDVKINNITPLAMKSFYTELKKHPSRYSGAKYQGKSFNERIAIAKMDNESTCSVRTINTYMERIAELFKYCEGYNFITKSPATAQIREKSNKSQMYKLEPFSVDDLKVLFSSDFYQKSGWKKGKTGHVEPYRFWLPLLALHSSCRLGELMQLELKNVYQVGGIWVLDIKEEINAKTGEVEKNIKTRSSIRKIPIHENILKIGFLQYVETIRDKYGDDSQLFPESETKQDAVDAAGKALAYILKKLNIHETNVKTFHSFRSSFINHALNQGIERKYIASVTGHLDMQDYQVAKELQESYERDLEPSVKLEHVISKIEFDYDFSGIKWSGGVYERKAINHTSKAG